jgi:hypothetical protein
LFCILFAIAVFAPLRWSMVAYIMLSAVDFNSGDSGVGILNTAERASAIPSSFCGALKALCGARKGGSGAGSVAAFDVVYAGTGGFLVAVSAIRAAKLTVEMFGSFLICLAFMRATKAGYLTPSSVLIPAAIGVIWLSACCAPFFCRTGEIHRIGSPASPPLKATRRCWLRCSLWLWALAPCKAWVRWLLCYRSSPRSCSMAAASMSLA